MTASGAALSVPASTVASVRLVSAPRDEDAAHVQLPLFDGPLALLLALIEQRKLDVLDVPLGDLTGDYLEALGEIGDAQMPQISAFVAIASQLILIKSRALLPRAPQPPAAAQDPEADPEEELRRRLVTYRTFRDAAGRLAERLASGQRLFHREAAVAQAAGESGARPAEPRLDPASLVEALGRTARIVPPPPPPPEIVPRTITLEERASVLRRALASAPTVVLQELLHGVRDRVVVAVTFLALLELVKVREVAIDQAEPWGPIECRALTA